MKALTLYNPWAWAMGRFKWNETRSWATSYRGPLAIHAGKTLDRDYLHEAVVEGYLTNPKAVGMVTGAIVAVGILADCRSTTGAIVNPDERFWGNYAEGRFMWMFKGLRAVTPIPCAGHQGLWGLPDSIAEQLAVLLPAHP